MSNIHQRVNWAAGRPKGLKKDPNRSKIRNPNGRLIDCNGPQYKNLLRNGYKENDEKTQLIICENFRKTTVKNPDTSRMIKINGPTFKKINRKYFYNIDSNEFYTQVYDPKNSEKKLNVTGSEVQKYIEKGYIFDKQKNAIIIPSRKSEKAFKNHMSVHDFHILSDDPLIQMKELNTRVSVLAARGLEEFKGISFNIGMVIEFTKPTENVNEFKMNEFTFVPKLKKLTNNSDISGSVHAMNQHINGMIDRFTNQGSGWVVSKISRHFININKYTPLAAKSYVALPPDIQNRKATINIKNTNDNKCFMYCLGRALDPNPEDHNLERVSKHLIKVCDELGLDKIEMPVCIKDVPKIEKMLDISINVFGHKGADIHPLLLTKLTGRKRNVDLLVTSDGTTNHYVLIKNFNKLCSKVTKNHLKKYFCMSCIQHFTTTEKLEKHKLDCLTINETQAVELPKKDSIIEFINRQKLVPVPFVIYADLEALLVPIQNCSPNSNASYTLKTHKHEACSYGYKIVCSENDKYSKPFKMFRGKDSIYKFFESLFEEEQEINKYMKKFKRTDMILTGDQIVEHDLAQTCYVCSNPFTDRNKKVRDHCHVSGKYRGAACNECNLQMKLTHKIPVVFHNLRGYDSHILMKELARFKRKINIIPNNMEKYMSFSVGTEITYYDKNTKSDKTRTIFNLTFIDSLQFMPSSLEKLVKNLKDGGLDKFKYAKQEFGENTELMTRKGIYPYSYMDSESKFDVDPRRLNSKDFTNDLTGEVIKAEDFEFYKSACDRLNIKTLGEYHDLYLKSDVLLLADVFENFRKMCMEYYGLDPCHYITAPGLSWDACLKMTGIELELISDIDQYLFVEKGLRGGISVITHRKGQANNKYMKNHDTSKPSKYIPYLDANNLYGWAMSQYLPYGGFEWINPENFNLKNVQVDSPKGHILEVDLEYPEKIHDLHNDYPYCPEQIVVTDEMLSDYSNLVAKQHNLKNGNFNKLIPNLCNKEKYVIHEINLKQAIDAGLILTKIHRVLEFDQKPWLKEYIDFNTSKRKLAKNDFEKDFFKLMNNSVFGKTMENLRKRKNIKLLTDEKLLNKYLSKPTFVNSKIFDENLVAIHHIKEKLLLNKPIYLGFCILELSKWLMYDFHYNVIKKDFGNKAQLLFTDTDSLCYEVETEDFYQYSYDNRHLFDLSDIKGKFQDNSNKKVIGKFKLEIESKTSEYKIAEFVGLRSKMYAIKYENDEESKKAKGVVSSVVKKDLKFQTYKDILESSGKMYSKMKVIRSQKHQMYTMEINKVSLSAYDDKRWIKNDGISSYAYGHYKISS